MKVAQTTDFIDHAEDGLGEQTFSFPLETTARSQVIRTTYLGNERSMRKSILILSNCTEGSMLGTRYIQNKQYKEELSRISHFSPESLLPMNQTLVINSETRTISLLSDGPKLIVEQQLSANELHLFVPILDSFPHYCPYEVLLSHLYANVNTAASIARCRQRLQEAQACGRWEQELRPVRRALSSLRN